MSQVNMFQDNHHPIGTGEMWLLFSTTKFTTRLSKMSTDLVESLSPRYGIGGINLVWNYILLTSTKLLYHCDVGGQ